MEYKVLITESLVDFFSADFENIYTEGVHLNLKDGEFEIIKEIALRNKLEIAILKRKDSATELED